MATLTLYGKPGCHLCEEARAVVDAVRDARPFELEEVDITRDPALEARYRRAHSGGRDRRRGSARTA